MKVILCTAVGLSLALVSCHAEGRTRAWQKNEEPAKQIKFQGRVSEPSPLTAALSVEQTTYNLRNDLFGKTKKDLKGPNQPKPPAVKLELTITNTSAKPITLMRGADAEQLIFELTGPGAVSVPAKIAMTMEYRLGKPTKIVPGESFTIAIGRLSFGKRGISRYAYWTRPGDYTLTVTYRGAAPKPNGTAHQTQRVTAIAPPVRLRAIQ